MNSPSPFHLSKWYLDCVGDNGDTFVGYSASLRWRVLPIEYSSMLIDGESIGHQTRATLQRCSSPIISDTSIRWSCAPLHIEGAWQAMASPIRRRLFETPEGAIDWECLQPQAEANVSVDDTHVIRGMGYAECIEISVRPWNLPIQELRWGRFLSKGSALLWIEVRGSQPQRHVFYNGVEDIQALVTDHIITFPDKSMSLTLEDSRVLREGPLVSTALAVIPGIDKLLPGRMLNTWECKWRSRGTLKQGGTEVNIGWAIHEVVRWG